MKILINHYKGYTMKAIHKNGLDGSHAFICSILALTNITAFTMGTTATAAISPKDFYEACITFNRTTPTIKYAQSFAKECKPIMHAMRETNNQLNAEQQTKYQIATMLLNLASFQAAIDLVSLSEPSFLKNIALMQKQLENKLVELGRPDLVDKGPHLIITTYQKSQNYCNLITKNLPQAMEHVSKKYAQPYSENCTAFFGRVQKTLKANDCDIQKNPNHESAMGLLTILEQHEKKCAQVSLLEGIVGADATIKMAIHEKNQEIAKKARDVKKELVAKLKETGFKFTPKQ